MRVCMTLLHTERALPPEWLQIISALPAQLLAYPEGHYFNPGLT